MVICLYLIDKNEGGCAVLHFLPRDGAERKVEVVGGACLFKESIAKFVLFHVDLNVVRKHPLPHVSDNVRFSYLACAANEQHTV